MYLKFCHEMQTYSGLLSVLDELTFLSFWNVPKLSLVILFVLKPRLHYINLATLAFLCLVFVWYIFSHLFTFKPSVSLYLMCISCKHHVVESCFLIHSDSLPLFLLLLFCFVWESFSLWRVNVITETLEFQSIVLLSGFYLFHPFLFLFLLFCLLSD